ncbi:MAG TPA: sulfite exporter TauE/SafE family protein [Acidimicrobiia bacterium]|nr:sulfite exporter TauE/SafE family protein [Acidimicrobiia bacterium]
MEPLTAVLLIAVGFAAGFVNTVAGGGSVITIPVLLEALGDAGLANGTNRIAILMAQVAATAGFRRAGKLDWRKIAPLVPATVAGAVAGAWIATRLDSEAMTKVFAFVLVLVALSVLIKPSRWLGGHEQSMREPLRSLVFFGVGFYGGFVQAGVGFLLLAALVVGGGLDLVRGNAAKVFLILVYTPVALVLFASAAQVDWAYGLVMGIGNVTGAVLATRLAVAKGAGWIRWVLIVMAFVAAGRMLFF